MRTSFKNFRKKYPKDEKAPKAVASSSNTSEEPPSKRARIYSDDDGQIDDEVYMEALQQLQVLKSHKKGGSHKEIKRLMELTKHRRHMWIREERPMIFDVIATFPCLSTSKWVSGII